MKRQKAVPRDIFQLKKSQTGIKGFDEITHGGLPQGRPSLIAGGPGSGKTLFAIEFLVNGAKMYNEPGVFMAFEETRPDLAANVGSLGIDLEGLIAQKRIVIDYVYIERAEIEETGEYDLEGLFIRLAHAIDSIKARRVALDTIEVLFAGLANQGILRAELRRLFRFLKEKGVTAVVTGERGEETFTRYGLEEYVADCVILLDHRVNEQISTRRIRVAKYRGTSHGTNEYPFLIDENGISVFPITSLTLDHAVSSKRISTGIASLDRMFGGKGYYRGSSVLISGTAGTGKSMISAHFVEAACRRGERCIIFAFEESPRQIIRNMRSVGIDLAPFVEQGLLLIRSERPTATGLEMHLLEMTQLIDSFDPDVVVLDPVTNLITVGLAADVQSILIRLVDYLKIKQITALIITLISSDNKIEAQNAGISSLMDSWMILKDLEEGGERHHTLSVIKSRGMKHSNRVCRYSLTDRGVVIEDNSMGRKRER